VIYTFRGIRTTPPPPLISRSSELGRSSSDAAAQIVITKICMRMATIYEATPVQILAFIILLGRKSGVLDSQPRFNAFSA